MLNIAIIGCGQIGSRHLQALSLIKEGAIIYLVDNSSESIDISKERFEQVVNKEERENFKIKVRKINEIESDIDVAIIATSSLNRAMLTKELIEHNNIKYIIFEKFLFQKRSDYDEIQFLLKDKSIKAWTNEWMCSTEGFQKIIKWVDDGNGIEIVVSGTSFGLGCNAVHFIDILDFISNRKIEFKNITSNLNDDIVKSKREGFYDVNGEIRLESGDNKLLIRSKDKKADGIISFSFFCSERIVIAEFSMGSMKCTFKEEGQADLTEEMPVPPQSQMTNKIVSDIVSLDRCDLPTYERSITHHKIILDLLDNHIRNNSNWSGEGCPIT